MTDWPAFAGFVGVVLAVLLVLARLSQTAIDREEPGRSDAAAAPPNRPGGPDGRTGRRDGRTTPDDAAPQTGGDATVEPTLLERTDPATAEGRGDPATTENRDDPATTENRDDPATAGSPSTGALLANVAVSQGALGTLLLAGAWYTGVPAAALGATPATLDGGALVAGVAVGTALYAANEAGAAVGRRVGFGGGEELRRALAPTSRGGWAVLLLVVLPVIAGFEELLFRGALVGALHVGFGVSPWLLAVGSSVAFAAGHGAQGPVGVVVTGTLGFVLAAAFVVTGSLLTVVVAHYLVNALEFLIHEWAGIDPGAGEWRPA